MDPHAVGGLLKKYLRSNTDPLLTVELFDRFLNIAGKFTFL